VNRNVTADTGRTSLRLEPDLWEAIHAICEPLHWDINRFVREAEAAIAEGGRTSRVRVYLVRRLQSAVAGKSHEAQS
jgi:predicted DNA-binding ribbon-helix-helix protein